LNLVEDSFGGEVATAIPVRGVGRTLEIRRPEDWTSLCRRFPLEVTASRRHVWFSTTGRDGRWLIPDWERVADEWDAVHLTVHGYLSGAGARFRSAPKRRQSSRDGTLTAPFGSPMWPASGRVRGSHGIAPPTAGPGAACSSRFGPAQRPFKGGWNCGRMGLFQHPFCPVCKENRPCPRPSILTLVSATTPGRP
jgi:hypothetical protein